jgi:hypothetical protein
VISIRGALDSEGNKLASLNTKGELLDLSGFTSERFYFKDLVFKGALRSGVNWGWLSNVELICDVTNWSSYFGATEPNFALFSYGDLLGLSDTTVESGANNLCQGLTSIGGATYTQNVSINTAQGNAYLANPGSILIAASTSLSTLSPDRATISLLQSQALFFGASNVSMLLRIVNDSSVTFAGTALLSSDVNQNPSVVGLGSIAEFGDSTIAGAVRFYVEDSIVNNITTAEMADITLNLTRSSARVIIPNSAVVAASAKNNSEVRMVGFGLNSSIELGFGSWLRDDTSTGIPEASVSCLVGLEKFNSLEEGVTCR